MGIFSFNKIKSFETVTLYTCGMRHVSEHEIVSKDGKAEVSLYAVEHSGGEKKLRLIKRAVCDEAAALKILNDCRLLSWDGFYGSHPKGVLDGTMFRMNAKVNGGREIYASGSQNFPRHFWDLSDWLNNVLSGE